jgi:hypothetical protein
MAWVHALHVVALLTLAGPALAQSRATGGDLTGVLRDETGGVLVAAAVTLRQPDTGLVRSAVTGPDGQFAFRSLPVGRYELSATLDGFEPLVLRDVALMLGATVHLAPTMKVAGSSYDVTVAAGRLQIDPQKAGLAHVIDRRQIDELPINTRNFITFSLLTPGVAPDRTPQQGASRTSGLVFAGQRSRSNNVTVDGLDNNDETVGSVRAVFSQDAVQEFQVLTTGYSAEFGKASGGVVNIVTRTGTNRIAGSTFAFGRDERLNARGHFERFDPSGREIAVPKAPYDQAQFGMTFGGPLKRDRAFFFGSVERLVVNAGNFVTIDDRTPVAHPFVPGLELGTAAGILRAAGFPIETGQVGYRVRSTQALARLDLLPGAYQRLTMRVNAAADLDENIEPFGGLVARSRAAALDNGDLMAAASHNIVVSGRLVNEVRFLVARRRQDVRALDPTCDGPCDREDEGGPTVEVSGFASAGRHRFTPTPRDNVRYQVVDTLSLAAGRHLLKTGVDLSIVQGKRQSLPLHFGGRYIFAPLPAIPGLLPAPVSAIQAVALGLPAAYVQGYGHSGSAYDYRDVALFVEDQWQARPGLTLRIGARYQRQFFPDTTYFVAGYPNPYRFPRDANNIAPRVGVVWDPTGAQRTVIRGAYGVYYDNLITAVAGITRYINGSDGVRTLVLSAPGSFAAWAAPERRLPEATATALAGGAFPSVAITIDPGLVTPYAHHASLGVDHRLGEGAMVSASVVVANGFKHLGTVDYNPVVTALGPNRRPADMNGVAGTSASVLQYTSFGQTWYRGLTVSLLGRAQARLHYSASYTWSKAEDNATDFQSAFLPQDNGRGRDPANIDGLPLGFDPLKERGPALHDQRHRLVFGGSYEAPAGVQVSALVSVASGWPFTVLAGEDLNGDRDGGSFPSDRARGVPSDIATSVPRGSGRFPMQASVDVRVSKAVRTGGRFRVDLLVEVFNLFNRSNFVDVQNVFGTGRHPDQPLPTFGQFTQAGPPRQTQLGARLSF